MQELKKTLKEVKRTIKEYKDENRPYLLRIDNYYDNVKALWNIRPFFYDKAKMFWFWNSTDFFWEVVDETDVLITIDKELSFGGQLVTGKIKSNYLEAFKQVGRSKVPKTAPKNWIQFKNKIYNIETKKVRDATPEYFCCNPIPWDIGKSTNTPVMDNLFTDWVGKKYIKTLYEIISYCCLISYPIHRMFCMVGSGRNGKSQFQKVVQKFIGDSNICSTELDLLVENRFESAKLFKKLVCSLGETNFGQMRNTSLLKKLSGGDLIGFEFKNKTPFDSENYAKIIINSNSLPTSLDTSDGFYRRWMIIDFPNEFPEGKDIFSTIPEEEYNNLARKVCEIIPQLFETGRFTNEGTINERRDRYIMASNPLPHFIKNYCEVDDELFVKGADMYIAYTQFLKHNKKRKVSKKEFYNSLNDEGFTAERCNKEVDGRWIKTNFVDGLKLKENWKILIFEAKTPKKISQISQKPLNSQLILHMEKEYEKQWKMTNLTNDKNVVLIMDVENYLRQNNDCHIETMKDDLNISDSIIDLIKSKGIAYEIRPGYLRMC